MLTAVQKEFHNNEVALIVADNFQPAYICELVNALARCGMPVHLIGGDIHGNQNYVEGVQFVNYRGDNSSTRPILKKAHDLIVYYFRLTLDVRRSKGSIVYKAGLGRPFLDNILMNLLFRFLGKKIIYTVHNVLPHGEEHIKNRILYWILYRCIADFLLVHTEAQKQRLATEFRVPESKITLAHHGTYHVAHNPECNKHMARRHLKLRPDAFVVLSFGYQRPYKGTHLLVEAMAKLTIKHTQLIIRGSATQEYAGRLTALIYEKRLAHCIDCDFGYVPDEELRRLFLAADIVALPYIEGSQSGVLFMAYAYGRPVLASDVGGFREYIIPGTTGEIFQTAEVDGIAKALAAAGEKRDAYDAKLIQQYAYRNYSWDAFAKKVLKEVYMR